MPVAATTDLISRYYAAFNAREWKDFFALLSEDVVHDLNQGGRETGKQAFRTFIDRMNASYSEEIVDIIVSEHASAERAAAEYVVLGTYLKTDEGLPTATGQTYRLPGGAFFEVRNGLIARVTNYYNLQDWLRQVGA
ncbi:MAG: nuclear transport factor 2 family protein [Pseudomonadota bacterium]|nr:nuclear transport factor 2 family protein [Pseudomonadota bacterium]